MRFPVTRRWRTWAIRGSVLTALQIGGCAVGPDFAPPAPPPVERYTPQKAESPGAGQRFREGAEIPARWWTVFASPRLDELIDEAIAASPTLEAAEAAIRAADFNAAAAAGAWFPQLALNSGSTYNLSSGDATNSTLLQTPFSYFTKQVQVSYTLDVWGATRRQVESLGAQRESLVYLKQAAQMMLAANIARAAIEEAMLRDEIAATRRIVALEEERLGLLERQLAYGAIASPEVLSQQTALTQALQTLPGLESRLAQQRNRLTALAGRYPSREIEATFELSRLALPRDLPVSLPSQLVKQRPDIKTAEANIHSASALVGVAVAARLPNVTLTAVGGTSAFQLAQLFAPGTGFYTLAGAVTQPAFDGFALLDKQRAAEALLQQAEAQYREVALKAFENVADSLRALQSDAHAVASARAAEATSKLYLDKVRFRLKQGDVSQLVVVDAQRAVLNATKTRIEAEAQRLADSVALFVALGGGWGQKEDQ